MNEVKVAAADFSKNSSTLADKAVVEPVTIGRKGHDRRVVRLEDLTAAEMGAIAGADVPAAFEHLDEELKDWKP
jgi:hypothetical protein